MPTVELLLLVAALLCSLVAGFLFAFAVVVMPGIGNLDDHDFLRAFQAIDRIIQNGQPRFMLMWAGSALALIGTAISAIWALSGIDRLLTIFAALIYVLGVQVPTISINIPLNNQIKGLDVATMTEAARRSARQTFEARWNRWNAIRTACAGIVSALLMLVLLRV